MEAYNITNLFVVFQEQYIIVYGISLHMAYLVFNLKHYTSDLLRDVADVAGVNIIRNCVQRLELLDPEITPAVTALSQNPGDRGVTKHLKLLMKEWTFELNNLVRVIDEMIDPKMFILVSGKCFLGFQYAIRFRKTIYPERGSIPSPPACSCLYQMVWLGIHYGVS